MRWIRLDDFLGRAVRVVDLVAHKLVSAPPGARPVGRIGVNLAQCRPPFGFPPSLEITRIRRPDDIAAHPFGVLDDKHGPRAQMCVRCGIDLPDQLWIAIECGGVVAAGTRRQANAEKVIQIRRPKGTDISHSLILARWHITLAAKETAMQADYVIIGAGSAGCVLAHRLSEDPGTRVMLVGAGGPDCNPLIHIPAGYIKLMDHPTLTWGFKAEPDPGVNGRAILYPRGRVLGGSSSSNVMIYVRGQPGDFDHWAQLGNRGWSWDDVLP